MDPITILIAVVVVAMLLVGYGLWKHHQAQAAPGTTDPLAVAEGVIHSLVDKLHNSTPILTTAPAAPSAPPSSIYSPAATNGELGKYAPLAAAIDKAVAKLDIPAPAPAAPARDAMRDGPFLITPYVAALNRPDLDTKINRIAQWWAESGSTIDEAIAAVEADKDLDGPAKALADAQRLRDQQANVEGVDFKGYVDVARLSLNDGFYLSAMAGRFAALTGQGSIWTAMLFGSANACNAFINLINSTNAGKLGTFDADAYQGQMKALVEAKIGGIA